MSLLSDRFVGASEISTGLHTGPFIGGFNQQNATNVETSDSFAYLPSGHFLGGKHQFKFGLDFRWSVQNYGNRRDLAAGDYYAIFNKGVPYEVQVYNYPFNPHDNEYDQSVYAMDTLSLKRVTLNLGVRWDRYDAFYPQQTTTPGQFAAIWPSFTEPKTHVLTWKDFTPRVVLSGSSALGGRWEFSIGPWADHQYWVSCSLNGHKLSIDLDEKTMRIGSVDACNAGTDVGSWFGDVRIFAGCSAPGGLAPIWPRSRRFTLLSAHAN